MKRILLCTFAAALALPLAAEDSPLVAAAKRANRLGKKPVSKVVITNETLKTSGANAHVTTAQQQAKITLPPQDPQQTEAAIAARRADQKRKAEAQAAADAKQKESEKQANAAGQAAQNAEEEYPDDVDPAQAEKQLQDAHKPPL